MSKGELEIDEYSYEWERIILGEELPPEILEIRIDEHKRNIREGKKSIFETDLEDDLPGKKWSWKL